MRQLEFRAHQLALIDKAFGADVVAGGFGPCYATKHLALKVVLCMGSLHTPAITALRTVATVESARVDLGCISEPCTWRASERRLSKPQ